MKNSTQKEIKNKQKKETFTKCHHQSQSLSWDNDRGQECEESLNFNQHYWRSHEHMGRNESSFS